MRKPRKPQKQIEQFVFNFNKPQAKPESNVERAEPEWTYDKSLEWDDSEEGYVGSYEEAMDSMAPDGYDQGFGSDNCS